MENVISGKFENFREATKRLKAIVLVLLFVFIFTLSSTEVYYVGLTPFGIGATYAIFSAGFDGYLLAGVFALAYILSNFGLNGVVVAVSCGVGLVVGEWLRSALKKKKKKFRLWYVIVLYLLSLLGLVVTNIGGLKENIALFVLVILSTLFLFLCMHFLNAVLRRGIWIGLNLDEKICGSVIFLVVMLGASRVQMAYFNFGVLLFPLVILLSTYIFKNGVGLMLSVLSGVALALGMGDTNYISLSVVLMVASVAFKGNIKLLSALAVEFCYIIFTLIFGMGMVYGEVISFAIGVLVFAFVPTKILKRVAKTFVLAKDGMQEEMVGRIRTSVEKRLEGLSQVFNEMNVTYRSMTKGLLPPKDAMALIKSELKSSFCDKCADRNNCYRSSGTFFQSALDMVVTNGYERGRVVLTDLPQYLTTNCSQVNAFVYALNNLLANYKDYAMAIKNLDTSKVLIAEQLYATSRLLSSLSLDIGASITFDKRLEERVREELRYSGIMCVEVAIFQKDVSVKEINIIVTNDTLDDKKLVKCVSKCLGVPVIITNKKPSTMPSSTAVTLISSPNYSIAFGVSSVKKFGSKSSGDSHSVIKIDEGKYLVTLTDGMGSGKRATTISTLTTKLIENFYRAGFDSDLILSTVNKLLALSEEENFATIDLCVIDGRKNTYDFIKLASSDGYILGATGECEVISGSNLPVGILDDVKPNVLGRLISNMDILVFVSDGVADVLSAHLSIPDYLRSLDILNPQELSDTILNRAIELSDGTPKDDMTVIAVRVFECK